MTTPTIERQCVRCSKPISNMKRSDVKYCGKGCRDKAQYEKIKDRNRLKVAEDNAHVSVSRRRGTTYSRMVDLGLAERILAGEITTTHAADIMEVTVASVSRSMGTYRKEVDAEHAAIQWEMDPYHRAMLPTATIEALRREVYDPDSELQQLMIQSVEASFWYFEHEFITIGSQQQTYIVKPFHTEALHEILLAFIWGTQVLILTPPRHGKSELIVRFVCWIIIMYPNIQVMWVSANTDLAAGFCGKLKGIFQYNKALRDAFLPPGKKFGDDGCKVWRENSFTLYTRTDHTLTSPTFIGLGSTSTVAGRNADFIGIDDLEERKTVATGDLRAKSREKHSEIMERKEEHTGVATIGSRQHPDDIPNHLIDQEGDDAWNVLVYPAHDEEGCLEDPIDMDAHIDCMLMPEIRSYKWLMARETETEALGLPGRFPLRYLQKAVPVEGIIFDIPLIKELCLDRSRGLGMEELPAMRLIAGLDPAARGTQAGFCWGWDGQTLHMIDLEDQSAGGVLGAAKLMRDWGEAFDLREWFHEDNSGQIDAWRHVDAYTEAIADMNVIMKPHTTGKNKHDPESGISSMASWYHKGKISLPYGTPAARRKVNKLLRQLELWTSDGLAKRGKTDIKMAHWFPFPRIQKWDREKDDNGITLELSQQSSYPEITTIANESPWGSTPYPGG